LRKNIEWLVDYSMCKDDERSPICYSRTSRNTSFHLDAGLVDNRFPFDQRVRRLSARSHGPKHEGGRSADESDELAPFHLTLLKGVGWGHGRKLSSRRAERKNCGKRPAAKKRDERARLHVPLKILFVEYLKPGTLRTSGEQTSLASATTWCYESPWLPSQGTPF
jgi:hypothetical protein